MKLTRALVCLWSSVLFAYAQDEGMAILENQKNLMEGDLKLDLLQTRNGVIGVGRKWPNGIIPYEIRSDYTTSQQNMIQGAMRRIEQSTCIRFVPRSGHRDYIYIHNTQDGCYTGGVGYRGGATEMSLQSSSGPNCMYHSVAVHELLHVVGLWHEHMRYDRDRFVKIHDENVASGMRSQFSVVRESQSSTYNVDYDYKSIMHYGKTAFSKDRQSITIEPIQTQFLNSIGQAKDISQSDILKVNRMYSCNGAGNSVVGNNDGVDPVLPSGGGSCLDLSQACPSYSTFCGRWELLSTHCRRTCKLC